MKIRVIRVKKEIAKKVLEFLEDIGKLRKTAGVRLNEDKFTVKKLTHVD